MSHQYAVIMAGGVGTRFWPTSTISKPKQFLDILGTGETLLQQTYRRMATIVPEANIYVVTHRDYVDLCLEQLPGLSRMRVLAEPSRRNTAPCIAYAAFKLKKRDPMANFVVTPSDHLIADEAAFKAAIESGLEATAEKNILLTLGIKPHKPETGYGYIQFNETSVNWHEEVKSVKTFMEKPNLEMAESFLATGEFLWNAGIFIWNANAILSAFEKDMPDLYSTLNAGWKVLNSEGEDAFIEDVYAECPNESIDYGILEKARQVYVMPVSFGWSDLGSWGAVHEQRPADDDGNTGKGPRTLTYNAHNNVIDLPRQMAAVISGLDDFIVIQSGDRLLICPKSEEQAIKRYVSDVKHDIGDDFV
jgi:mannose-1-phosphate guanylyltransferase